MAFETSLRDLCNPEKKLTAKQLAAFDRLDRDQMLEFDDAWQQVAPSRKLMVLSSLADLAEDNLDLAFDAIFKLAIDDDEAQVRAAGVRGLYEYEGSDLIPVLAGLLRDDADADVRREGAVALGRFALAAEFDRLDARDAQLVRQALTDAVLDEDEDERVRARAIEALGVLSDDETRNLIESMYAEESLWLKVGAMDAMGRNCDEAWLPVVLRELTSQAPEMRHAAAFAAGEIGSEDAIAGLAELARYDPDREVQMAAVQALGEIGGRRARVALQGLLYRGDDDLREAVEEALAELALQDSPLSGLGG